jgi:hypothetical protein
MHGASLNLPAGFEVVTVHRLDAITVSKDVSWQQRPSPRGRASPYLTGGVARDPIARNLCLTSSALRLYAKSPLRSCGEADITRLHFHSADQFEEERESRGCRRGGTRRALAIGIGGEGEPQLSAPPRLPARRHDDDAASSSS